eukprot:g18023.t1
MKQEAMKKLSMGTTSGPEAMGYISLLRANFKLSCKEYTMLISFLSTRTLWKSALTLFSEMPDWRPFSEREAIPDQTAYTTAIAACRLAKRWTHALELYAKMCDELMPPTISTLNALISVCGQSERWREALLVFEEIAGFSLRPDGVTLKATLEAATEGRQWPLALRLLRATPQPEAYHFNQALRACERSSCWRESLQLLKDIRDSNLAPSLQQYHFGISAVSAASYWSLALALLAEAEQSGQRARPESVEAVLNACLVARQSAFAWQLLPKGLERGSIVSATEMVASLYQTPWQETLEQLAACPSSWLAGTFRPALRASRAWLGLSFARMDPDWPRSLSFGPGCAAHAAPWDFSAMELYPPKDDPWLPLVLTFISWLTFSLTMLLFAFGEEIGHTIWAVWLSALLLAIFVLSMAWARRMPGQMLLGYFLLAALLLAVPFGESVAESFMDEFFRLRGGAAYRLKASTAGASVLDATVLHFEKGDFVNASKSIGFKKAGHLYCVAPLLSQRPSVVEKGLIIVDIQDSPAVIQWNLENPQLPVEVGHLILEVNGISMDGRAMLQAFKTDRVVDLVLQTSLNELLRLKRETRLNNLLEAVSAGEGELEPCSICYEELAQDTAVVKLPCDHRFHEDTRCTVDEECVKKWLVSGRLCCPLCNTQLASETL